MVTASKETAVLIGGRIIMTIRYEEHKTMVANVNLYSASSQKKTTPLMFSMCRVLFKNKHLQCVTKNSRVRLAQVV